MPLLTSLQLLQALNQVVNHNADARVADMSCLLLLINMLVD